MEREDFQNTWEEIVCKGISNYSSLNRQERVWFNIEPLTTDGLIDHYINYGAQHNIETLEDLKLLGQIEVYDLMYRFNHNFKNGVPSDIDERNEQIGQFNESFIDEIDKKFWELCENLEIALLNFIKENFS